jgi:hypothetical protein
MMQTVGKIINLLKATFTLALAFKFKQEMSIGEWPIVGCSM